MDSIKIIQGGVTAAKGFFAAGVEAGIKYENRKDMALIYSESPCRVAGTFTSNLVKAACVLWDQEVVENVEYAQAVVVNSGVANACTGAQGYEYCEQTAVKMAEAFSIDKDAVLIASTGVIGKQLPMDRIIIGIDKLANSKENTIEAGTKAAEAIMTTDTHSKQFAVEFELDGKKVTLGGMCKGSGMIHPNMCTMLGFLTTDLAISKELLKEALKLDVVDTYNMVSVDGDTSTNDTLLILANGEAGNEEITSKNYAYEVFCKALNMVNTELAKQMAGDGEGATALFETKVIHAKTKEQARVLAKSVICSSLTKAAIFGHDANWGRILCAMGYSGAEFNPDYMDLYFQGKSGTILIFRDGVATDYSEEEASKILSDSQVTVPVDLKEGTCEAAAWGCDLSYDYVKINADYRS